MGTQMKKTIAASAIAGAAVGFGALLAAPLASADTNDNTGWWLGSGNASGNNTIIGQAGSGNANQFGNFNGNIQNNQLNALSPVIGGTATQANVTSPVTTQAQTNVPVSALNGAALGTTLGAGTTTSAASPIGAAVPIGAAGNLTGANAGAAVPINAGAAVPIQIPVQVPAALGTINGANNNAGVGAQQSGPTTGAVIDDSDTANNAQTATNSQVASSSATSVNDNHTTSSGGNTTQNSTLNGGTVRNSTTNVNTATAGGNIAHNTSNNNTNTGSGTNSNTSVGNNNG
jgi:hypothetical protein